MNKGIDLSKDLILSKKWPDWRSVELKSFHSKEYQDESGKKRFVDCYSV
jgi:hypothetical protein